MKNIHKKERIKLKRGMRATKVANMINLVNHQNLKMNKDKSKEQSKGDTIWGKKSNRNIGASKFLSVISLNLLNGLITLNKRYRLCDRNKKQDPTIYRL
jgi:hypothetical protein